MHDHDREGGHKVATRCKVQCIGVEKAKNYSKDPEFVFSSKFAAVTSGSDENKAFFASTPSVEMRLLTAREDHFTPGKTYYVDFTEAPE